MRNYTGSFGTATTPSTTAAAHHLVFTGQATSGTANVDLIACHDVQVRDMYENDVSWRRQVDHGRRCRPDPGHRVDDRLHHEADDATARSSYADLNVDTPGVFVLNATSGSLVDAFSDTITIRSGSMLSDVAAADPGWQNHIDGVDTCS